MRVLHVIHGYQPECQGGAESYVRDLAMEQRRRGGDVAILTGSYVPHPRCSIEELALDGITVFRLHRDDAYFDWHAKAWHPGVERLVRDLWTRVRPDVLHVHQWIRLTSNLLEIADGLGIPAVITLHDLYTSCPRAFRVRPDDQPCFRPLAVESCLECVPRYGHEPDAEIAESILLHRDQYRSELARARAVLVASPRTAELVCTSTGFPAGRFTLLPMAYARRFPPGTRGAAPLPRAGEPFRFGYWGSMTRRKGAHVLVQAFARAVAQAPRPAELHLFGRADTDALDRELRALAAGLPVTFHGRYEYEQVRAARLHMAVFPMLCFETFGFVLDEACELGLPSIVTDIGAMPLRAGAAALKAQPNDVASLAECLTRVLARPALRDELAASIPALPPGIELHAAEVERVYARARAGGPPVAEVEAVDPLRRAALLVAQRESALGALHPGRGPG